MLIIILILSSLTSCGSNKSYDYEAMEENSVAEDVEYTSDSVVESDSNSVSDNRKIIENIDFSLQTKEFDKLIDNLEKRIIDIGGYIETSNIYGKDDFENKRTAEMTVRIPSDKSGKFTDFVKKSGVVISKSVSTEDVTLKYVDIESRLSVLEAEKVSLEKLLKSAKTMTDIIAVREKLTDVISSIESYKTQLRTYDNLVDYST